jgi:outer membrane murein-binding lipoprotein Lpp
MKLALVLAISLLAGCTKKAAVTEAAVSQVVETTSGHVEPVESVEPAAETK